MFTLRLFTGRRISARSRRTLDTPSESGLKMDDSRQRGHATRIQDEEHIVARRRKVGIGRRGYRQRAGSNRKIQWKEALTHVNRVRHGSKANQRHIGYPRCIRRLNCELLSIRQLPRS